MNKSQRIRTDVGSNADKHLKIKLEQDVKTIEILSLKIDQKDLYQSFNSDYGVLIGRVVANGGIGVPNAKISVFIPISEEDKQNKDIYAVYPYETPRDKNADGVRYNLLPRVSVQNPFNTTGEYSPAVPVGTFPTKQEIVTNSTLLEVYEKYYKYSTVTNRSGDYMIFGVPVGVHTVHMSVDITDIGNFSMTPGTMISQLGYSPQLFENNKVKYSTDLDTIPNIETQNISVDIIPFWGDTENFEIGITRQDFKIRATLVSSVTVFGVGFTDHECAAWGREGEDYVGADSRDSISAMGRNRLLESNGVTIIDGIKYNVGINSRRNGNFSIEVYTISPDISMEDIQTGNFDTTTDIILLDKSQYSEILKDGMFILTLPCNRSKKVVNEQGELVDTTNDDPNGIFTQFVGMFIVDYGPELNTEPVNPSKASRNRTDRGRLKIPQYAKEPTFQTIGPFTIEVSESFSSERSGTIGGKNQIERIALNEIWRKQAFTFEGGKIYTVAKFYGAAYEDIHSGSWDIKYSTTGTTSNRSLNTWRNAGGLAIISSDDTSQDFVSNVSATYQVPLSGPSQSVPAFVGEWLNMALYFPQLYNSTEHDGIDVSRILTTDVGDFTDMTVQNNYKVVGYRRDTSYFLRSDLHQTTFVEVPKDDLVTIIQNAPNKKGFTTLDPEFSGKPLIGNYAGLDSVKYFFRGLHDADIIQFLVDNGIIIA